MHYAPLVGASRRRFAVFAVFCLPSALATAGSFKTMGLFPGDVSPTYSRAYGISANGLVVVGENGSSSTGFRWTPLEGTTQLGLFGSSQAFGANADGSIMVGHEGVNAAVWPHPDTGVEYLPCAPNSGCSGYYARAISADGAVIAGFTTEDDGQHPFRWTASEGTVLLDLLPADPPFGPSGIALGMSSDGQVIVGRSRTNAGFQAVRWTVSGGIESLGTGSDGHAYDANADGSVIVGKVNLGTGSRAFRWTQATGMEWLPLPASATYNDARAVSDDGLVIVGFAGTPGQGNFPFIWTPAEGSRDLRPLVGAGGGWLDMKAHAISADGTTIAGDGYTTGGF